MSKFCRTALQAIRPMCLAGVMLLPAAIASADTVYLPTAKDPNGFATKNVTVTKIVKDGDHESLVYQTENGEKRTKSLEQIVKIEAEGEPAFNQAENDFVKGDLKAANDGYRKALSTSTKEWLKHRAEVRLLGISGQIGDFLGGVSGFVELARKDPASATQHKPDLKTAKPEQLQPAIDVVNKGLVGSRANVKGVLLPFLVELYNKKGDTAGANKTLTELKAMDGLQSAGTSASADTGGSTAAALAAKSAEADVALTAANTAMAARQYDQVITSIQSHSAAFAVPDRQAKALYLLAEAKAAQAATPEALADAALAYMRVVAHFKSQPDAPVADALYKTGAIEEKLQKPSEALLLYKQVVSEYKDSKAAQDAQAAIARLTKG